jgi:hypothetical protein
MASVGRREIRKYKKRKRIVKKGAGKLIKKNGEKLKKSKNERDKEEGN